MFKQQRQAVGYVPKHQLGLLKLKLAQAGYEPHSGPRASRAREVATYRVAFNGADGLRQNHVQVVDRGKVLAVYAHTEPHTKRFVAHALVALGDEASFAGGSRMLRNNLNAIGYCLASYADALDAHRQRRG